MDKSASQDSNAAPQKPVRVGQFWTPIVGQYSMPIDTKGKVERMVGYVKQHFFVRYRDFADFAHLDQLLEQWLIEEADRRLHGTVKEVVAVRFEREREALMPLPAHRFDTSYVQTRQVGWDAYIDVRGNRYSVPAPYCGQTVTVYISLNDELAVYAGERCIARHRLVDAQAGWQTVADHHRRLWAEVAVQARSLDSYEEVIHARTFPRLWH